MRRHVALTFASPAMLTEPRERISRERPMVGGPWKNAVAPHAAI
jgi:hypothetical protein